MPTSLLSPYLPASSNSQYFFQFSSLYSFSNTFINNNKQHGIPIRVASLTIFARAPHESILSKTCSVAERTHEFNSTKVSKLVDTYGINFVEKIDGFPIREEQEDLDFGRSNSKLQVQSYVDRLKALPIADKAQILQILEKDGGFYKLSDFNDLLMALVITDVLEIALKLFGDLSSYGLAADSRTFSILIRCYCKKSEPSEGKQVLDYMLGKGFKPNVATFTVVINSFCKRGKLQKAFEILDIMSGIGCQPTIQTYNCLMKGLCFVGRVEEAYELLMNIKKTTKRADIYSYTAVMDGLCKVGRTNEANELLNEALEMGLTPNVVTFNTLFNGYFKEGRPLEGICLLKQMKRRNCKPDYISYSTLLHGLLKWGKIRAAFLIYKEMEGIGFRVDERMMNTLLRGLCRRSWKEEELLKDAYEVFEKMKNGYSVIYSCAYGLVIQTLCIGKDTNKALANLHEMIRMGYLPRMINFNSVIRAFCLEGKVNEALSVLILAYEVGKIPSRISYNLLIDEFNRQGRLFCACNVYGAALKLQVTPHRKPKECLRMDSCSAHV